jgi:hypothetical protein
MQIAGKLVDLAAGTAVTAGIKSGSRRHRASAVGAAALQTGKPARDEKVGCRVQNKP